VGERFAELLERIRFDDEVLAWVSQALRVSHEDERQHHEDAIRRIQAEYERLQNRIDAMYIDKLDGRVDADFFDRKAAEWRTEPLAYSISSHPPINGGFSASYYRTAPGRTLS
jgi:hypothetical protein